MRCLLLLLCVLTSSLIYAQYQMGSNPLRANTSLAGTKSASRICGNFLQTFNGSYNEYDRRLNYAFFSYDNYIKAIKSGIGVYYWRGTMKNSSSLDFYNLNSSTVGVCIAPKLSNAVHFPSVTLSPSIGFEWINYKLSYGAPGFDDVEKRKNLTAIRLGLLLNTSNYFLGTNIRYLSNNAHQMLYASLHGGYVFQKNTSSRFSFSPTISCQFIEAFGQQNPEAPDENYFYIDALNLNFRYQKILFGTGIPTAMLGFQTKKLKAMVSYNFGLIKMNNFFDGQTSLQNIQFSIVYTNTRGQ